MAIDSTPRRGLWLLKNNHKNGDNIGIQDGITMEYRCICTVYDLGVSENG
jgi:hypothetical protein